MGQEWNQFKGEVEELASARLGEDFSATFFYPLDRVLEYKIRDVSSSYSMEFDVRHVEPLLDQAATYLESCMELRDSFEELEILVVESILSRNRMIEERRINLDRIKDLTDKEHNPIQPSYFQQLAKQTAVESNDGQFKGSDDSVEDAEKRHNYELAHLRSLLDEKHKYDSGVWANQDSESSAWNYKMRFSRAYKLYQQDFMRAYKRLICVSRGVPLVYPSLCKKRNELGQLVRPLPDFTETGYLDLLVDYVRMLLDDIEGFTLEEEETEMVFELRRGWLRSVEDSDPRMNNQAWHAFVGNNPGDPGSKQLKFTIRKEDFPGVQEDIQGDKHVRLKGIAAQYVLNNDLRKPSDVANDPISYCPLICKPPKQKQFVFKGGEPKLLMGTATRINDRQFIGRSIFNYSPIGEWTVELPWNLGSNANTWDLNDIIIHMRVAYLPERD